LEPFTLFLLLFNLNIKSKGYPPLNMVDADRGEYSRRDFLQKFGVGVPAIALAPRIFLLRGVHSGTPSAVSLQDQVEEYDLEEDGDYLVDSKLPMLDHPFMAGLRASFDAGRSGGSSRLDIDYKKEGQLRLVTHENSPDPGDIYNMPHLIGPGAPELYLVIRFAIGDVEVSYLGFRTLEDPCITGYENMRAYMFTRDNDGKLKGRFIGAKDFLDPNTLTPRDAEAAGYFNKNC
jgi:hypothetical protein